MKKISTILTSLYITVTVMVAQPTPQPPNAGFENWTGSGATIEATNYHSNKSGTGWASLGGQTCFKETSGPHSGSFCARIETISSLGNAVNGSLTSGIVNAPTTNKADGYIGTMEGASGSTINRIAFNGRPDSLVGWYKYTQSTTATGTGGANEIGKVYAILHLGNYYDPSAASSYHPDSSINKVGEALFLTPASNVGAWTRFSVPFSYVSAVTPQYILLNCTSSNNQLTSVSGSKLWLDDIGVVYHVSSVGVNDQEVKDENLKVYTFDKIIYVDFMTRTEGLSSISIFDITGKLISKQQLHNNRLNSFSVSELGSGMYLYELSGNNFHKSGKLLIN